MSEIINLKKNKMSKKSKKIKNKQKPVMKFDDHFITRLKQRFSNISMDEVENVIKYSKRYTSNHIDSCPYKVVRKKMMNDMYSDSIYLVNYKYNTILVAVKNVITTVLYLDGSEGYSFVN